MRQQLYVDLVATLSRFSPPLAAASKQLDAFGRDVSGMSSKAQQDLRRTQDRYLQVADKVGKASLVAGGAVLAGMGMAVKAAVQWESAWAGVLKTASTDDPLQLAQLEGDLRALAKTLPTTHQEIAAVAEAAGQLGVETPKVAAFTRVMIDLGQTTNLSAEDAATGLARMMNVMQTAPADVERLGSTLVALGNAGASTEDEILRMAQRIAGAGATIGASEADVLALSNALSSMGVNAELGSGVMTRTLLELETAASQGATGLQDYAKVAGVSAQEFARAWEEDPVRALAMFTTGLGELQASGGNAVKALEDIGAQGTLDKQVLLALAASGDLLTESLDLGSRAWQENSALVEEARKRYDTTESRMRIAQNTVRDFAIDLGEVLLPALAGVADGVADVAKWLSGLPEPVKQALAVLATVGGVVGVVGGAALIAVPKVLALRNSLIELGVISGTTTGKLSGLGAALKVLGVAGLIATVAMGLDQLWSGMARGGPDVAAMTSSLLAFGESGKASGALVSAFGRDLSGLGDVIERAGKNKWAEEMKGWIDPTNWFGDEQGAISVQEAKNQIDSLDKALAGLVQSGHPEEAAVLFEQMGRRAREQGTSVDELRGVTDDYQAALRAQTAAQDLATEAAEQQAYATAGATTETENAYASLGNLARQQGLTEEATKELVKQVEAWGQSLADFINPLGAYEGLLARKEEAERTTAQQTADSTEDATDSWETYAQDVSVSVDDYLAELERMVADQQAWATNMTLLAGRVSTSTLDELARMGPEGAPLIAKLVNASDAELARMEAAFINRTKASVDGQAEQWRLWGELAPVLTAKIGKDAVTGLSEQLAAGTTTVAQIAAQYGVALANGVNPILTAVGQRKIVLNQQEGRGYMGPVARAQGGSVYGPGTSTSDSIPALLSDGEYVVRADAVRAYGEGFLDDLNQMRLRGGGAVKRFATGGFATTSDVPKPPSPGRSGPPVSTAATTTMNLAYEAAMQAVRDLAPQMMSFQAGASAKGLNPQFLAMFQAYNSAIGGVLRIVSGWRSREQQARLYAQKPGLAAPPGRSNHERGLAIDHAPRSTAAMRATASRFGLRYPMSYEPWHVEPASIRRSRGGAVRPRRMATGGIVHGGAVSAANPVSLTTATRGMTDPEAIRRVVEQWEAYNRELEEAARLQELLAKEEEARAAIRAAKTVEEEARAYEELNRAMQATTDHTLAAQRDREGAAVDRLIAKLEAEIAVRQRLAAIRDEAFGNLNGLLDQAVTVRGRIEDSQKRHNETMTRLAEQRAQAETSYQEQVGEAAAARAAQTSAAHQRLLQDQQQLLQARRTQLSEWASLDQRSVVQWGNSLQQLLTNAADQAAQFQEWMTSLASARARGVSEQVIAALGLDEGPEALGQLRQFGKATDQEIARLNAAVALRQQQAAQQTTVEQLASYGELGRGLVAAQQEYQQALAEANATYGSAIASAGADLAEALAENDKAVKEEQQRFAEEQKELTKELKSIGKDQGRSFADAIAEGLRSGIPGIVAAAQAALAAMTNATANGAGSPGVAAPGAPPRGTAGIVFVNGQQVHVNDKGIIDTPGPYYGLYPTQAIAGARAPAPTTTPPKTTTPSIPAAPGQAYPGAPPRGTAGYVTIGGVQYHVNTAGIIDTPGANYGKYPLQVKTFDTGGWLEPGFTLAYNGTGVRERVSTAEQSSLQAGGLTININGPVFGVDHLHAQIRAGATALLEQQRTSSRLAMPRG